jgi:hypothetical protein
LRRCPTHEKARIIDSLERAIEALGFRVLMNETGVVGGEVTRL